MNPKQHSPYYIICADEGGSNRIVETVAHDIESQSVTLTEEVQGHYILEKKWLEKTGYQVKRRVKK